MDNRPPIRVFSPLSLCTPSKPAGTGNICHDDHLRCHDRSLFEPPGSPCGALVLKLVWDLPSLPALLEARVQRISAHRKWAAAPGAQLLPI